ncbi:hypothetical protein BST81_19455 [Leptolyngbya sp. 'hensonii']|nr:hypothetical protein BST81_19455 [Leptolyngbya sp. 'hensonii']
MQTTGTGSRFFTVYQTDCAIELHAGCPDQEQFRVICTCLYYEQACEIARIAANLHSLPVMNFVEQCLPG